MPLTGAEFAEFAKFLADLPDFGTQAPVQSAARAAISALDPAPAVIRCAKEASAITDEQAKKLTALVSQERFSALVGRNDPLVLSPQEMRNVPPGAFIAFIYVKPLTTPAAITRDAVPEGMRYLIHVMVSLGNGRAAGTKGQNLGLPVVTGDWQEVDLSASLLWNAVPHTYDAIAESLGSGSPRHLRIRYRTLEDLFQINRIQPGSQQNLVSPLTLQEYSPLVAPGWWFWEGRDDFPSEGWKLHVSCSADNAAVILNLVLPKLREGNFIHKFLLTMDKVKEQNADPVQAGKVIAIYPKDIVEAFNIVGIVDNALISGQANRPASPPIANEIHVGNTVVYARYGPFQDKKGTWILDQAGTTYVPDPKGSARPSWVPDPWSAYPNQTALSTLRPWPLHILPYPKQTRGF